MSTIPQCTLYPFICWWTIVNIAAMNIECKNLLNYNFLLIYAQEWDFWDYMAILFLVFWEIFILFSTAAPIYILINSVGGLPCSTPSPICYLQTSCFFVSWPHVLFLCFLATLDAVCGTSVTRDQNPGPLQGKWWNLPGKSCSSFLMITILQFSVSDTHCGSCLHFSNN